MKLVVTIDAEEDNWGNSSLAAYTLENIARLPALQQLFDDFQFKPTYLLTYPVAASKEGVAILRELLEAGKCEIGAQCHPWNTPPFEEERIKSNSMLCNLPADLQYRKMIVLHETIHRNFDIEPVSFRSGRWGYSQDVARNMHRIGYKIDTSITPYTDWTHLSGRDFSHMTPRFFRFSIEDVFRESSTGQLLEVPVTIGYIGCLNWHSASGDAILQLIKRKPLNRLRLSSILYRLNLMRKVWLSPEVSDATSMIKLIKQLTKHSYEVINMVFHSTSLTHGFTPFVRTKEEEEIFSARIKAVLAFTRDAGIDPITLSDVLHPVC